MRLKVKGSKFEERGRGQTRPPEIGGRKRRAPLKGKGCSTHSSLHAFTWVPPTCESSVDGRSPRQGTQGDRDRGGLGAAAGFCRGHGDFWDAVLPACRSGRIRRQVRIRVCPTIARFEARRGSSRVFQPAVFPEDGGGCMSFGLRAGCAEFRRSREGCGHVPEFSPTIYCSRPSQPGGQ